MANLHDVFSIYIKLVMLGIGIYMVFVRGKSLHTVNHLEKEARFTKVVGWAYIVVVVTLVLFRV